MCDTRRKSSRLKKVVQIACAADKRYEAITDSSLDVIRQPRDVTVYDSNEADDHVPGLLFVACYRMSTSRPTEGKRGNDLPIKKTVPAGGPTLSCMMHGRSLQLYLKVEKESSVKIFVASLVHGV